MIKGGRYQRVEVKCTEPGCNTLVKCASNTANRAVCPVHLRMRRKFRDRETSIKERENKVYEVYRSDGAMCRVCKRRFVNGLCWCD